jgi:predicted nucleotidyltransferase
MVEKEDKRLIIDIVAKYADTVNKEIKVDKIILYGSYSKGNPHKDSDIDVAVISPDFTGDKIEDRLRLMKCRWNIDLRIEPMPFKPEDFVPDDPFVREIIETGIEVNQTPST